jgi:stearoyl-CoA desaturase (delta-9 desaturase)
VKDEPKPPLLWIQTTVFAATFLIAAIGVPWYALSVGFEWSAIVAFVLFCGATGISITAGYHRLWAHNAAVLCPLRRRNGPEQHPELGERPSPPSSPCGR